MSVGTILTMSIKGVEVKNNQSQCSPRVSGERPTIQPIIQHVSLRKGFPERGALIAKKS
jgi:hypothetical protein